MYTDIGSITESISQFSPPNLKRRIWEEAQAPQDRTARPGE